MGSGLKEITFIFENCEYITIDGKYVGDFLVDDIKTSFARIACNYIGKQVSADTFVIEIHKDANKERNPFNELDDTVWGESHKHPTFNRFKGCDITSIEFVLEKEVDENTMRTEKYKYYTTWTGDDWQINEAQSNYISKDGNLYVVIAEDKKVEDFFDLEEINDSEYMDFHFDMLDIGDKYGDPNRYNEVEENE